MVSQQAIGARVPIELIRQGQRRTVTVAIAERPTEEELARLNGIERRADATTAATPAASRPSDRSRPASARPSRASASRVQALTPALAQQLQIRDANVRGLVVGTRRSEQRRRPEGPAARRHHPVDQPDAGADARGGRRGGRRGAARPGATRCCCWSAAATTPPAYVGVELARAAAALTVAPLGPAPASAQAMR